MFNIVRKITDTMVIIIFIVLVIVVFAQIFSRSVFDYGISFADELARYLFIWLIYLGGTITIRKGINITFDVLLDSLKGKAYKIVFTIVNIVSLSFLAMAVVLGLKLSISNLVQSSSIMKVNMGVIMLAIPVGSFLMFFEQISLYLTTMKSVKQRETEGSDLC